MEEIRRLWAEHRAAPFPADCRGEEIDGVELVRLDADIAGCVDTFVRSDGRLDRRRRAVLAQCRADAATVSSGLTGASRAYFEWLARLASRARSAAVARLPTNVERADWLACAAEPCDEDRQARRFTG